MSLSNHAISSALLGVIFLFSPALPVSAKDDKAYEQRRQQCTMWMTEGYPSGLEEKSCTSDFGLPSPFLFVCAKAQRNGFESENQKRACSLFFEKASADAQKGVVRR